jgi:hypothetical protein
MSEAAVVRRVIKRTQVMALVCEMHGQEQIITRETLAERLSASMSIVDDHLGSLCDGGMITRVQRGVYVPTEVHPVARICSVTMLPDETIKVDVGDCVLTLTPKEARMLATMLSGHATQMASIELGHHAALLAGELRNRINALEREVR